MAIAIPNQLVLHGLMFMNVTIATHNTFRAMNKKWVAPKYKKHQEVRYPKGTGKVASIHHTAAGYMYEVAGSFYLEEEIKAI